MKVWRISNYADLKGEGGVRFGGRWHTKGKPVIYTAEHPALAMLEILVNIPTGNLPGNYRLLEIAMPDGTAIDVAEPKAKWQDDLSITRRSGDSWLIERKSAVLKVPSALLPHTYNYLINPLHADARKFRVLSAQDYPFDRRLK